MSTTRSRAYRWCLSKAAGPPLFRGRRWLGQKLAEVRLAITTFLCRPVMPWWLRHRGIAAAKRYGQTTLAARLCPSHRLLSDSILLVACGIAAIVLTAGCATHERRLLAIRDGFYAGDLPNAETALAEGLKHDRRDHDVLLLEKSIVDLAEGRPKDAEKALR
ncbi:MAG: hypothetical protein ACREHD_04360, partial [Pirellulales bacterium]